MRVGIYCGITVPEDGGANSLIDTIKNELIQNKTKHNFVFCFLIEKKKNIVIDNDGFKYINIHKVISLSQRIKLRIMKIGLLNYMKYSRYDIVASIAKLDLLYRCKT